MQQRRALAQSIRTFVEWDSRNRRGKLKGMKTMMITTLVVVLTSSLAWARGDNDPFGEFALGGFYGIASVSPPNINTLSSAVPSTPGLSGISTDTFYGGSFEFVASPHLNLRVAFDSHDAKNLTSTNLGTSTGYEITENNIWGILDFYLVRGKNFYAYFGAGVGAPTYFHLAQTTTSGSQRTVQPLTCYEGDVGIGVMLGKHFSLYFEGGYQQIVSGNIQDSTGNTLLLSNGSAATINLSGPRGDIGVKFHY